MWQSSYYKQMFGVNTQKVSAEASPALGSVGSHKFSEFLAFEDEEDWERDHGKNPWSRLPQSIFGFPGAGLVKGSLWYAETWTIISCQHIRRLQGTISEASNIRKRVDWLHRELTEL